MQHHSKYGQVQASWHHVLCSNCVMWDFRALHACTIKLTVFQNSPKLNHVLGKYVHLAFCAWFLTVGLLEYLSWVALMIWMKRLRLACETWPKRWTWFTRSVSFNLRGQVFNSARCMQQIVHEQLPSHNNDRFPFLPKPQRNGNHFCVTGRARHWNNNNK